MTLYIVYSLVVSNLTGKLVVLHNTNITDIIYSFYENCWPICA